MSIDEKKLEDFVGQAMSDMAATASSLMVVVGHKLGLYRAMAGAGALSAAQVAERSECDPRYVREWLNNQVAGGYIAYDRAGDRYELSDEHALVLADDTSPFFIPPALEVPAAMWADEEKTLHAFRTGEGVPWRAHHDRLFSGTAAFFRNGYRQHLTAEWLPALDGVVDKLAQGGKVADVGCGYGHSSILMAQEFPEARVNGYDNHDGSIQAARGNAQAAGVDDRVKFQLASAKDFPGNDHDLICYFDCLHDMGDPVGAAKHAFDALADDGAVMLVEPRAGDSPDENQNPVGRMFYAASTAICCAHSKSEEVGLALGAQAGEKRLSEVFREAGFTRFRRAAETPFNLILEARP